MEGGIKQKGEGGVEGFIFSPFPLKSPILTLLISAWEGIHAVVQFQIFPRFKFFQTSLIFIFLCFRT